MPSRMATVGQARWPEAEPLPRDFAAEAWYGAGTMDAPAFPYQLAVSDLDGTLLGPHKEISAANVTAVRRLQATGARFILASGRRHQNSLRFQRQLGLDGLLISCAGAMVKDPQTDRILHEVVIPAELADGLVAGGEAAGYTVIYYHRNHLYVTETNHWTDLYESRVGEQAERYPGSLHDLHGEAALKIVWYGEPSALQASRPKLEQEYQGRLEVLSTDAENLEFSATGADKARALAFAADFYGVVQGTTVAFGDGENDAPMLRWAGLGVAMNNGKPQAKDAAKLVSPAGAPEESFARAVDAIFAQIV